jgi:PKD repeat protein
MKTIFTPGILTRFARIKRWYIAVLLFLLSASAQAQTPTCRAFFLQFPKNTNADSIHFFYVGLPMTTYTWHFSDGTTSNIANPWHYFSLPGTYTACLTVFDSTAGGTCTDSTCATITISGTGVNCNPRYIHFAAGANQENVNFFYIGSAATTYAWTFGDGGTSTIQNPTHLYTAPGTYQVCVTITDSTANGTCTGTFCDSVVVTNPPPTCNPRYFKFAANGNPDSIRFFYFGSQATSYAWTFGDGGTSSIQNPTHTYPGPGTYIACVTITDSTSGGTCTGTFCDTVKIVIPPPVCNPHYVHNVVNGTDSIRFNYNGSAATTYAWTFGDGTTSTLQNPVHMYPTTGNYTTCVTITTTNLGGTCTATFCDSFHVVIHPPVCNAHFNRNTLGSPDSIQFTYNGSAATTYAWDFGDGTTSTLQNPLHVFAQGGTYHVCVTITTTNGAGTCSNTYCRNSIIPITPPVCSAHFGHFSTANLDSIAFLYNGSAALTYAWNFGDGGTSTAKNPSHTYATYGHYNVCVTITNTTNGGSCSNTWCDSVIVLAAAPVCDAHFQHIATTNIDSVLFFPLNTSAHTYSWDFGDGGTSTSPTPSHTYAGGGAYYVCLTITDSTAGGTCTNTVCDSVHIPYPAPICDGQFTYVISAQPDSVNFNAVSTTAATYTWDFGDSNSSSDPNPSHIYATSGTYVVCLTVTNSTLGGTCTNTWCDTLHIVIPPPTCVATYTNYSQFNNPDSVHFTADVSTEKTYTWDFADGTVLTTTSDVWHQYATPGNYVVCLTVTDSTKGGTCTSTWCDTIHIPYPAPVCSAQFTSFNINNADSIQFFYSGSTALTYSWNFGDGNTSTDPNPTHAYHNTVPTMYYVCVTITDSTAGGTCTNTWCDSIAAMVTPPTCDATFTSIFGSTPDSLFFYPSNTGMATYSWDFGDGSNSSQPSTWHQYASKGNFTVCLTVTNVNGGGSCTDTKCDTVSVTGLTGIETYIQNAVSVHIYPNPMNEYAIIELTNLNDKADFILYDMDGRVVYKNNEIHNGNFRLETKAITSGLYFYSVNNQNQLLSKGKIVIMH